VRRNAFVAALDEGNWRLALVAGGPAYGKSTGVAQWVRDLEDRTAVWLTLDAFDDRPDRFWLCLALVLEDAIPGGFLGSVAATSGTASKEVRAVEALLADFVLLDDQVVVVLDDVHEIRSAGILDELAYLIEHLPDSVQLVIISRSDPPFPLSLWRVRGWVLDLRIRELAFDLSEALALFGQMRHDDINPSAVERLWKETNGWVAGLRIAASAIERTGDVEAAVRLISDGDPLIADLLVSEVLGKQSDATVDFLLRTSIVDVMDPEMCNQLTGRSDASSILQDMEDGLQFISASDADRSTYRYHGLLLHALRSELEIRSPHLIAPLSNTAAALYVARGQVTEAILCLLRAGEQDEAFSLAYAEAYKHHDRADLQAVAAWMSLIPTEHVLQSAGRMLAYAFSLGAIGRSDSAMAWLRRAEDRINQDPAPRIEDVVSLDTLRTIASTVHGLWPDGIEPGTRALHEIARGVRIGTPGARLRSNLARAHLLAGEHELALQIIAAGSDGDEVANLVLLPAISSRCASLRGDVDQAMHLSSEAVRCADALGLPSHIGVLDAYLGLADAQLQRNEVESALSSLGRVDEILELHPEALVYRVLSRAIRARVAWGSGLLDEAARLIEEMRDELIGIDHPPLHAIIHAIHARVCLESGDLEAAAEVIGGLPRDSRATELLEARLALCTGQFDAFCALVRSMVGGTAREQLEIELLRLRSIASQGLDAVEQVAVVLDIASPQCLARVILEEGLESTRLVRHMAELRSTPSHRRIAEALGLPEPVAIHDARSISLSDREQAVLRLLPTNLTNQEIGAECFMSVNTVKTHVKSIYVKLGVTRRSDAVRRARASGLL
jgi:LuxR family maltose regulon positive regulatory protein